MTPPSAIRLSVEERSRLLWVRTRTGLPTFAAPCRWALALSLAVPSDPPTHQLPGDGLEIARSTLGGRYAELWWACVVERHGDAAPQALLAHLHRGIGLLRGERDLSPARLLGLVTGREKP